MSKASEEELATMHGAIAKGLTEILTEGVDMVVKTGRGEDAETEVIKTPASAAYYMAAITFAKNNGITADPTRNKELSDLEAALKARRQNAKGALSKRTIEETASVFERDLGTGFDA